MTKLLFIVIYLVINDNIIEFVHYIVHVQNCISLGLRIKKHLRQCLSRLFQLIIYRKITTSCKNLIKNWLQY